MGYPVKLHLVMPGMELPIKEDTRPTASASCDRLADVIQPEVQVVADRLERMRGDITLKAVHVIVEYKYK